MSNIMPRDKLVSDGIASLDDVELLAILLGTGAAQLSVIELAESLLHAFGGLRGLLQARRDTLENQLVPGHTPPCHRI
jgi:DNA repair protein RadC